MQFDAQFANGERGFTRELGKQNYHEQQEIFKGQKRDEKEQDLYLIFQLVYTLTQVRLCISWNIRAILS